MLAFPTSNACMNMQHLANTTRSKRTGTGHEPLNNRTWQSLQDAPSERPGETQKEPPPRRAGTVEKSHTRRATVSTAPFHAPPRTESTHSGHSWIFCFLHVPTAGEGYRRAANHPKNKQHPTTFTLPSSRSRRQFIPQTPICQNKRQSVLWKYHTSFYVISNPPGEQPHQGVFSCSTNQNPKNTCRHPKETLQGNLFNNPSGHAAWACPHIAA